MSCTDQPTPAVMPASSNSLQRPFSPSERRWRTLNQSSTKPIAPHASVTKRTVRPASVYLLSARNGITPEITISRPPIVGVPCFRWCSAGSSARMCWPNSFRRRNSMNFGPARMEIAIARMPAARTRSTTAPSGNAARSLGREPQARDRTPTSQGPKTLVRRRVGSGAACSRARGRHVVPDRALGRNPCERLRDDLEPDRPRALDEHDVAGLHELRGALRRLRRVLDPLATVGARELADAEDEVDAEIAHELSDLAVVLGRGRAELGHLAEDRDLAALVLREVLQRGAHRARVRVVGVVDQQAAAGQRRLLAAPARQLDVHSPVRETKTERPHREQRRDRVLRLVPSRERELELELLAAKREHDAATALDPLERRDVLLAEALELDVVTAEVGLEQGLVRDDRGAVRGQRPDHLRLRAGNVLDRPEQLEVHRSDARDHADLRTRE